MERVFEYPSFAIKPETYTLGAMASPTVLIVDDELDIRETLSDVLAAEGFSVQTVCHGREALQYLEQNPPPALILLDLMMPDMDGWQFRVQQRQTPALAQIPVIAMTANQSSQAAAIDAQGFLTKPFSITALLRSVREVLRQVELDRERATEQLVALGRLAGGVAHEINNPLAYLLSNLQLLQERFVPVLRASTRSGTPLGLPLEEVEDTVAMLAEALEGAHRIRAIVHDIQIATDTRPDRLEPVQVEAVLESALATVGTRLSDRAKVKRKYGTTQPVRCERSRLEQAFVELLGNAADALAPDRRHQNVLELTTFERDGHAVVEVRDNGEGIGARALMKVFEPFFTTRPVGQGTGLGLFITRGIITALGGTVEAESEPGKGATFRVHLPLPATLAAAGKGPAGDGKPGRPSVLIVDDDALVARALARRLQGDFQVRVVTDAAEAKMLLTHGDFDLVLCDLHMPGITGMELFRAVKSARPGAERRIVFMTGAAFTDEARDFAAQVENPVLEKPVDPKYLRALIRSSGTPGFR